VKVLIIPEDPELDQYILKPVVEHIFADLGRRARVDVLREPRLRGVAQALDTKIVAQIVEDNPMEDLFLIMVDRDGDREGNEQKAAEREKEHVKKLLACLAIEEVEVWMLALHRDSLGVPFKEVRAHHDPKEAYAAPFLKAQGWTEDRVGRGRKRAMRELGANWRGLLQVCPELADLRDRIDVWLASRP